MTADLYLIPKTLGQDVLDYLSGRPYKEVAGLIHRLLALDPAPVKETP